MRVVRGEGTWKCQGQEVWCQGGEAEKGVKPAVKVGKVGKLEVDGKWMCHSAVGDEWSGTGGSRARKTRG